MGTKKLKLTRGWLRPIQMGVKTFDMRLGRRGFKIGDIIEFREEQTNQSILVKITKVIYSWTSPPEWDWRKMPEFEVFDFVVIPSPKKCIICTEECLNLNSDGFEYCCLHLPPEYIRHNLMHWLCKVCAARLIIR